EGAIVIPGVVVVVDDVGPLPVAPRATAPIAPPPVIAARKPAVTSALWIRVMNLLLRLPGTLARRHQRVLRISSTNPKSWGFSADSQERLPRCACECRHERPPDPRRRRRAVDRRRRRDGAPLRGLPGRGGGHGSRGAGRGG